MSLLYRKGYFTQRIDESGWQFEDDDFWDPRQHMIPLPKEVTLELEGRTVHVRAWMYKLVGARGKQNPIIFLDTDVPGNSDEDRAITARLYSGDARDRLRQEAVLGIAGLRMLLALGATNVQKFHMNEGHSALLTIELYREYASCADPAEEVRQRTAFTTHTPVAAGHDAFDEDLVLRELGVHFVPAAIYPTVMKDGRLHMTELALQFSGFVNGVAKRHGEITRELFPGYHIESITNGVYANGWVGDAHTRLFDRYLPGWRTDPYNLRYALSIPLGELWDTHMEEKRGLVSYVNDVHHAGFDERIFTIGFARRATEYKRGNMLFGDISRLNAIAEKFGGLQIVYAGKAHPRDENGKHLIQGIIGSMHHLSPKVRAVYLPDYDMKMAKRLVSGVDLWLNTPARPMEASGTSGMKAALNGVPQFSVLDGWWLEGHIEGVTGYSIGAHPEEGDRGDAFREDMEDMYTKLEYVILPRFSGEHDRWVKMMRQAIAINGSFFNTHRMVEQYVLGAYFK
jgi:starch phosphorylase